MSVTCSPPAMVVVVAVVNLKFLSRADNMIKQFL